VDLYRLLDDDEAGLMKADIQNDERELDLRNSNFQHTEEVLFHAPMRELEDAEAKAIAAITEYYRIKREELTTKAKQRQEIFNGAQERVQSRLERRRAIAAPLKKLPPEILSEIFMMHVEMGGSPWVTLKVSRWWMRVSTSTLRLWRNIHVVPRARFCDSGAAHQLCSSKKQLQKAMRRAGVVPIRLHVDFGSWETQRDVLAFIVESLDRFYSLELFRSPCLRGSKEETEFLDSLRYGAARNLRELALGHDWKIESIVTRLLSVVGTSKGALKCLTASSNRWLQLLGQHKKIFLNLRTLSFSGWASSSSEDELLQKCFSSIRHLECLSINVGLTPLVDVVTLVDNLQELDIRGTSLEPLYLLRIPKLKKLVLTNVHPKYPQKFTISLPQLEVLHVKSSPWTCMRALYCPALRELVLGTGTGMYEKGPTKPQLAFIWTSDHRCLNPRVLHLQGGAKDPALITTLRKMAAIERLHLTLPIDAMLGDAFFDAFSAPKSTQRIRWLPELRSIEITCTDSESSKSLTDAAKLKDGLQKVINSRAGWAPITSAVLNTISTRSTPHTHHRHELAVPGALAEASLIRGHERMVVDTWGPIQGE